MNPQMKPRLYYYEHCPFCVRVLTLAGLANIDLQKEILLNDDEKTPIAMTGVKSLPILEYAPKQYMGESLDIIDYLCEQSGFQLDNNPAEIHAVGELLQNNRRFIFGLSMPRWVQMPFAEFATDKAVAYFIEKKTQAIGDFDEAISKTAEWSRELKIVLQDNEELFEKLTQKPNNRASIMLFSALLGVTGVKDFQWTDASEIFMKTMSKAANIALLTDKAV